MLAKQEPYISVTKVYIRLMCLILTKAHILT